MSEQHRLHSGWTFWLQKRTGAAAKSSRESCVTPTALSASLPRAPPLCSLAPVAARAGWMEAIVPFGGPSAVFNTAEGFWSTYRCARAARSRWVPRRSSRLAHARPARLCARLCHCAPRSHLVRPDSLRNGQIMLFREGVKPFWEDEHNRAGGKVRARRGRGAAPPRHPPPPPRPPRPPIRLRSCLSRCARARATRSGRRLCSR